MNFAKFPYLRIALAFIGGIFTSEYFGFSPYLLSILLFCSVLLYICWSGFSKYSQNTASILGAIMLLCVFMTGGFVFSIRHHSLVNSPLKDYIGDQVVVYGTIAERLSSSGNQKLLLQAKYFKNKHGHIFSDRSNIILKFSEADSIASAYQAGYRVVVPALLKNIPGNTNPEAFDYAFYLKTKSIIYQSFVQKGKHKKDISANEKIYWDIAGTTSAYASRIINKHIQGEENNAIAHALLLGQKLLLSEDIYKSYTNTGAIHVLSVSGLHVAIFISLFVWLFSKVKNQQNWWKWLKVCLLISIVWFYVVLTGMSPSVVRAGLMVTLYIIGTHFFKGTNAFNLLSLAAICMLLYNPFYLFQASFQFSFLSLLSILYFQPKIAAWWHPPTKITKFFWDLINVSLAAQILVFPVTVYYFHQFPVYFAVSGIIAVPIVTLIIYGGTILIAADGLLGSVSKILGSAIDFLLTALNGSIKWISEWPASIIANIWIAPLELILLLLIVVLLILWLESRHTSIFYSMLVLLIFVLVNKEMRKVHNSVLSKVIVYDTYGANVVDLISGGRRKTVITGRSDEKSINFTTLNNRIKLGVADRDISSNQVSDVRLWKIGNKTVYINSVDEHPAKIKMQDIDILIITKNKLNDPDLWLDRFHPDYVVLDRNVPDWIEKKWLTLQQKFGYKLHIIKSSGAIDIRM